MTDSRIPGQDEKVWYLKFWWSNQPQEQDSSPFVTGQKEISIGVAGIDLRVGFEKMKYLSSDAFCFICKTGVEREEAQEGAGTRGRRDEGSGHLQI